MAYRQGEQGSGRHQSTDPRQPAPHPRPGELHRLSGRATVPNQGRASVAAPYERGTAAPALPRPRRTPPRQAPLRRNRMTVLGCVAIVALLTVLGIGGYLAFSGADPASGGDPANGGRPVTKGHDITSQQADPAPLTLAEVFPGAAVTPAGRPYQLVKSQSSANCRSAVVGDLGDLVSAAGCTQVQRATFTSPDKTYVATAGVFNLRDEASATRVAAGIQTSLSGAKGRLSGYPAGGATDVLGRAATRAGWDVRGHFLIYAVVARVDGAQITDEAAVRPIIEDLVERYLNQTVLQARSAKSGP